MKTLIWRVAMSSLFPERSWPGPRRVPFAACLVTVPLLFAIPSSRAAQVYFQPVVTLSEQYDSNLDLAPTEQQANIGYIADAATLIGIASPDSDTSIRPRLRYSEYPNEAVLNRLEAMLDLNSSYSTPRSRFNIFGRFDHLNDTEAEIPTAVYNDVTPNAPTVTQTGAINLNVTRNNVWTSPSYSWRLTPT